MSFGKVTLFGFDLTNAATVGAVADDIMQHYANTGTGPADRLITPNASMVVYYNEPENRDLKTVHSHSAYILPDGMPLVWLSRLKSKHPLQARLTGSDLFPVLWQKIKDANIPATMVLASEELAGRYQEDYQNCIAYVPALFTADDETYINAFAAKVADGIVSNRSAFLFIGLTFPKQERLGMAIEQALKERNYSTSILILHLGASFEFYFGLKKRAPAMFRKTGMEWFYRFMSEPGRLWKRYTVDNIRFIILAVKELLTRSRKS